MARSDRREPAVAACETHRQTRSGKTIGPGETHRFEPTGTMKLLGSRMLNILMISAAMATARWGANQASRDFTIPLAAPPRLFDRPPLPARGEGTCREHQKSVCRGQCRPGAERHRAPEHPPPGRVGQSPAAPAATVRFVDNGVDVGYYALRSVSPVSSSVVYIGAMDHAPDGDDLVWFAAAILSSWRARQPDKSSCSRRSARRLVNCESSARSFGTSVESFGRGN